MPGTGHFNFALTGSLGLMYPVKPGDSMTDDPEPTTYKAPMGVDDDDSELVTMPSGLPLCSKLCASLGVVFSEAARSSGSVESTSASTGSVSSRQSTAFAAAASTQDDDSDDEVWKHGKTLSIRGQG